MPDKTKTVFSGADELEVDEEPSQVMDALIRKESFHRLTKTDGVHVYIMPDRAAYIEHVPASQPSESLISRGGSVASRAR
jgi:hypothetical protein